MTDISAGFLKDIRENPEDDTPRLVYADWLDENGDPEWAEFIRAQVGVQAELARLKSQGHPTDPQQFTPDKCADCRRIIHLRDRERQLFTEPADRAPYPSSTAA